MTYSSLPGKCSAVRICQFLHSGLEHIFRDILSFPGPLCCNISPYFLSSYHTQPMHILLNTTRFIRAFCGLIYIFHYTGASHSLLKMYISPAFETFSQHRYRQLCFQYWYFYPVTWKMFSIIFAIHLCNMHFAFNTAIFDLLKANIYCNNVQICRM